MFESLHFIGTGAGEKKPGAGQKRTGSATLNTAHNTVHIFMTQ